MLDHGNGQLSAVGFFNPMLGAESVTVAGGGGSAGFAQAFDIDDNKIVNCGLVFGRRWLKCDDTEIGGLDSPDGVIYATVQHDGTSDPELSVHKGSKLPDNGVDATHRALYLAVGDSGDGKTWVDVRYAPTLMAMD